MVQLVPRPEGPTCAEIGDCCGYLKLPLTVEVHGDLSIVLNCIRALVDLIE